MSLHKLFRPDESSYTSLNIITTDATTRMPTYSIHTIDLLFGDKTLTVFVGWKF